MALGRLGASPGQAQAATRLKPDPNDKNVSPAELARYVRERGYYATARVGGSTATLRGLLAVGVPVIVETWFVPKPGDEMGHYRLLVGYDDARAVFAADDSFNGPGIELPYGELDRLWRVFNRTFVAVCPEEKAADVSRVLGALADDGSMYVRAAEVAERELVAAPDAFGYFNLGSSLLGLGDAAGAAGAFDRARGLGLPWRMLWYQSGPFEAYAKVGRWDDVADLAAANLANAANLEESHYWLGMARQAQGDQDGARQSWKTAVDLNPLCQECVAALAGTPAP
jgi:tetratricopeptide (TPR) repeat protein